MLWLILIAQIHLRLPVVDSPINVDGVLESVWQNAVCLTDFKVFEPSNVDIPAYKTRLLLLQSEDALYVAFDCEFGEDVRKVITIRDNQDGDYVGIFLDSFNNRRTAYYFAVSAAGVQVDRIVLANGKISDGSWDGVWYSAAKIEGEQYIVEIKIPFRTIQYDRSKPVFGFEAVRFISDKNQKLYLGSYTRERGVRVEDFPIQLEVFPPIPSIGMEALPVFLIERNDTSVVPKAGMDIKWTPNNSVSFNATFLPDFAQIEADPYSVNLGKYEEYIEERRPFFIEGNDVFKFNSNAYLINIGPAVNLFYTRRIGRAVTSGVFVPILFGVKGYFKTRNFESGVLSSYTGRVAWISEDGDTIQESRALYNVFSIRNQFLENSTICFLYSGKIEEGSSHQNHAGGIDFHLLQNNTELAGSISRSFSRGICGNAITLNLASVKERYHILLSYYNVDSRFDVSEVGFTPWTGLKRYFGLAGPNFPLSVGFFDYVTISGGFLKTFEETDGFKAQNFFLAHTSFNFKDGSGAEFFAAMGNEYESGYFRSTQVSLEGWTSEGKSTRYSLKIYYERGFNYFREYIGRVFSHGFTIVNVSNPRVGLKLTTKGWLELDPTDRVEEYTLFFSPKIQYAVTSSMVLNVFSQHTYAFKSRYFPMNGYSFVASYNFRPKSWLYFVISRTYSEEGATQKANYVVLKVRYLFSF